MQKNWIRWESLKSIKMWMELQITDLSIQEYLSMISFKSWISFKLSIGLYDKYEVIVILTSITVNFLLPLTKCSKYFMLYTPHDYLLIVLRYFRSSSIHFPFHSRQKNSFFRQLIAIASGLVLYMLKYFVLPVIIDEK